MSIEQEIYYLDALHFYGAPVIPGRFGINEPFHICTAEPSEDQRTVLQDYVDGELIIVLEDDGKKVSYMPLIPLPSIIIDMDVDFHKGADTIQANFGFLATDFCGYKFISDPHKNQFIIDLEKQADFAWPLLIKLAYEKCGRTIDDAKKTLAKYGKEFPQSTIDMYDRLGITKKD